MSSVKRPAHSFVRSRGRPLHLLRSGGCLPHRLHHQTSELCSAYRHRPRDGVHRISTHRIVPVSTDSRSCDTFLSCLVLFCTSLFCCGSESSAKSLHPRSDSAAPAHAVRVGRDACLWGGDVHAKLRSKRLGRGQSRRTTPCHGEPFHGPPITTHQVVCKLVS